jgi:hypothetical protein
LSWHHGNKAGGSPRDERQAETAPASSLMGSTSSGDCWCSSAVRFAHHAGPQKKSTSLPPASKYYRSHFRSHFHYRFLQHRRRLPRCLPLSPQREGSRGAPCCRYGSWVPEGENSPARQRKNWVMTNVVKPEIMSRGVQSCLLGYTAV